MSQVISFQEAKRLTLDRLEQRMRELPVSERSRPTYVIDFKSFSVLELINQVRRDTDIGKKYIYQTMSHLGYSVR